VAARDLCVREYPLAAESDEQQLYAGYSYLFNWHKLDNAVHYKPNTATTLFLL